MFYNQERIAVFIDGYNLSSTANALNMAIDYGKLRDEFVRRGRLVRLTYFLSIIHSGDDYAPARPLADWLSYNGYVVRMRTIRDYGEKDADQLRRKARSGMSVDFTIEALEIGRRVDHVVLFSGDGDYVELVHALQRKGVRVSIVSSVNSNGFKVSDELRRQADNFIDLKDLKQVIQRDERVTT